MKKYLFLFILVLLCQFLDMFFDLGLSCQIAIFGIDDIALATMAVGGLGAVGSAFSNASTNKTNMKINQRQMDWQTAENQKQRDFTSEMYDKNNEYNLPSAQMQRLRDAGINPFLNQSEIGSFAQSASTPSVGSAPSPIPAKPVIDQGVSGFVPAIAQGVSQLRQSVTQEQLAKSSSFKQYADGINQIAQTFGADAAKKVLEQTLPNWKEFDYNQGDLHQMAMMQMKQIESQSRLNNIQAKIQEEVGLDIAKATYNNLNQAYVESTGRVGLMSAQAEMFNASAHYTEEKVKTIASEIARNFAAAFKDTELGKLLKSQRLQLDTVLQYLDTRLQIDMGNYAMEYLENYATFQNREPIRKWKESKQGQVETMANDRFQNFPLFKLGQEVNKTAAPLLEKYLHTRPSSESGSMTTTYDYGY